MLYNTVELQLYEYSIMQNAIHVTQSFVIKINVRDLIAHKRVAAISKIKLDNIVK